MATLLNPFIRAMDANGDPVSGGKLAVFLAGTTTPVTTYSDRSLTTAQAQPLIANAAGEFEQSFVAAGIYKIRVSGSDDVVLYENDNVRIADRPDEPVFFETRAAVLADTNTYADGTQIFVIGDGSNYLYTAAASGATDHDATNTGGQKLYYRLRGYKTVSDLLSSTETARGTGNIWEAAGFRYEEAASGATDNHVTTSAGVKLYVLPDSNGYNVEAFGVVGDDTTDDATPLQAAFDALENGDTLNFGDKMDIVSNQKITISGKNRLKIIGNRSRYAPSDHPAEIEFTDCEEIVFKEVVLDGQDLCGSGLAFINCRNLVVSDCIFRNFSNAHSGFSYGVIANTLSSSVTKRAGLHVSNCLFEEIDRDGLQTKSYDDVTITNCRFRAIGGRGIDAHAYDVTTPIGNGMTVTNCIFDGCSTGCIDPGVTNFTISNCVMRNSGAAVYLTDNAQGVVDGIKADNVTRGIHAINGDLSGGIEIKNCAIEATEAHVKVHDTGSNSLQMTIEGNRFIGTPSSNHIDIRRTGGNVVLRGNEYNNGTIYVADEGASALGWLIDEVITVFVSDASHTYVSRFLSNTNFSGLFVSLYDMTGFDPQYCGEAGFSDVSPPATPVLFSWNGANVGFQSSAPTTASAGKLRTGPNNNGQFAIRNDTGSGRRVQIRFRKA